MSPQYRLPESVLVLICNTQHQVLLLERADVPGYWQSVTGGLEPGETPLQTARREVFEETGLDADAICDLNTRVSFEIHPRWRHRYAPHQKTNLEHQFALIVDPGASVVLNPAEHLRFGWYSPRAAREKVSSWSNRQAIERLLAE